MNPYAIFLGERSAREVIEETPVRLTAYVRRLGAEGLEKNSAPGKWNARQILCHLADCEIAFGFRIRQALAEPDHVIQPFDQDKWAKSYASLDADLALDAFFAARRWNLALIETIPPDQFAKTLSHPERGPMTLQTVIETMGGHDLNHLAQIERLAGS